MLDTGSLHELLTTSVPDWTSQTWKIDWENNRLLSQRIDGKEAVAQASLIVLFTEYEKYEIFSDRFGNELYDYIGYDSGLLKANAERLIKEALSPDLRILKVLNFSITELDKYTFHIEFDLQCEDGIEHVIWEMPNE